MLNRLSASFGYIVAPRNEAYTPGPMGHGLLRSMRTVFASTTVAPFSDEYQFCAHEDLISGESSRSVVHLTSSAVTSLPSCHLAAGSSWNVYDRPSLAC